MFYSAIFMGLAGSLHCAGMCSPLAMAITRNKPFLLSTILYNSGRVFLYSFLGTLAAAFGSLIHLNAYQQIISIALGSLFLLAGMNIYKMRIPYFNKAITMLTFNLKKLFSTISYQKSKPTTFVMGMLNGMLPCGLTYLALSACLILPKASDGFLFMLSFGLGSWPVMFGVTKLLRLNFFKKNFSLHRLSSLAMIVIGCTLLLRVWLIHPHGHDFLSKSASPITVCK